MNTTLKRQLHKDSIVHIYFKVKNSKLSNQEKLKYQIELAVKRLMKIHNIKSGRVELLFGTIDDDFIQDRCRLRISFNGLEL